MSDVLKELLVLLEERLVEHDESRKEVQNKLLEICSKITKDPDSLEEKISGDISKNYNAKEEEIYSLIEKLNEGEGDIDGLVKKAKEELSKEWKYEIQYSKKAKSFVKSYGLKVSSAKVEKELNFDSTEAIVNALQEHLEKIQRSKDAAEEKLMEICNQIRKKAEELKERVNGKLEDVFKVEDARIQEVVKIVKEKIGSGNPEEVKELAKKAKLTILRKQKYSLKGNSLDNCDFRVEKEVSLKYIDLEERKPTILIPSFTKKWELSLSFTFFDGDEEEILKEVGSPFNVEVKMWEKGHEAETSKTLTKEFTFKKDEPVYFRGTFPASTTCCLKMRIVHQETSTQWSHEVEFTTPEFKDLCTWKECPGDVDRNREYSVDERNPRIARKIGNDSYYCTITGNTSLPLGKVTSWSIKILELWDNDESNIFIGVAPSDIDQDTDDNHNNCGWYFYCYRSTLFSGPPHNYKWPGKDYGPRKEKGKYFNEGDSVDVVMDTTNGELSFVVNGVNLGVAYEGIPLDKPLVPCVILKNELDSVELVI